MQENLNRIFTGKYAGILSIIVSALVFGVLHIAYGFPYMLAAFAISGTKVFFAFVIFNPISRMEKLVVFRIIKNMMMEIPSITKLITCPGSSIFRWHNRLQRNRYTHTQIISTENTAEASLRCLLSFATSVTSEKTTTIPIFFSPSSPYRKEEVRRNDFNS